MDPHDVTLCNQTLNFTMSGADYLNNWNSLTSSEWKHTPHWKKYIKCTVMNCPRVKNVNLDKNDEDEWRQKNLYGPLLWGLHWSVFLGISGYLSFEPTQFFSRNTKKIIFKSLKFDLFQLNKSFFLFIFTVSWRTYITFGSFSFFGTPSKNWIACCVHRSPSLPVVWRFLSSFFATCLCFQLAVVSTWWQFNPLIEIRLIRIKVETDTKISMTRFVTRLIT